MTNTPTPRDFSIDIETLSTRSNAAIVSVGISMFDLDAGTVERTYEAHVSNIIGHVDMRTIVWWMQQDKAAQEATFTDSGRQLIGKVLDDISKIITPDDRVWGNGATMDVTILESAYQSTGKKIPWRYWNIRDLRTLASVAESLGLDVRAIRSQLLVGQTAHSAIDDAVMQATLAVECYRILKETKASADSAHMVPHLVAKVEQLERAIAYPTMALTTPRGN